MNFMGSNYSTYGCQTQPTFEQCKQVVQTCNVEEVPHYINYHTHVVNNLVKKHINIPTYSVSEENVLIEYPPAQAIPMYNPVMPTCQGTYQQSMFVGSNMYNQQMPNIAQYQGNVGTEPMMGYGMQPGYVKPMPFTY